MLHLRLFLLLIVMIVIVMDKATIEYKGNNTIHYSRSTIDPQQIPVGIQYISQFKPRLKSQRIDSLLIVVEFFLQSMHLYLQIKLMLDLILLLLKMVGLPLK